MSGEETEMQTLLKERGAAHNSLMMADEYLKFGLVFPVQWIVRPRSRTRDAPRQKGSTQ